MNKMKFKFHAIVDQYQRLVFSLAIHILGNRAEAEDATQEVYEKLWRNMGNVDLEDVKPWLMRVTRNLCIDVLRKRHESVDIEIERACPRTDSSPTACLAQFQLSAWLKNAIARLKEPYRSLIVMRDLQQHSIYDIAQVMSMTENNVKVSIHRGRKQLKEMLQKVDL